MGSGFSGRLVKLGMTLGGDEGGMYPFLKLNDFHALATAVRVSNYEAKTDVFQVSDHGQFHFITMTMSLRDSLTTVSFRLFDPSL